MDDILGTHRQGAIRFRRLGTRDYYSTHRNAVPRLLDLPRLLHAVGHLDDGAIPRT